MRTIFVNTQQELQDSLYGYILSGVPCKTYFGFETKPQAFEVERLQLRYEIRPHNEQLVFNWEEL